MRTWLVLLLPMFSVMTYHDTRTTIIVPEQGLSDSSKSQINYLNQRPPGMTAELFAPGIISSPLYEHSAPAFAPDGSRVVWAVYDGRGYLLESVYKNGEWSKPAKPSFIDTLQGYVYPTFSIDGKKLYFSSDMPAVTGGPRSNGNRIWEVPFNDNAWGKPVPLDTMTFPGNHYANAVTADGTIYFSAGTTGSTHWNLYRSSKTNGKYSKPELLPYNINSKDYEDGAYIAPDESFLIFESQRPEGTDGNLSLFISFKNKNGGWSLPVNMGPRINSGKGERFARLSPDGKYLFFGSFRNPAPGSRGADIYWIDAAVIDELRNASAGIEPALGADMIRALDKGDVDASAKLLQRWMQLYPGNMDARVIYSSVLRRQKHYDDAAKLFTGDLTQWNGNSGVVMEMALIQFGLNKAEEAKKMLEPILAQPMDLRKKLMYLADELFTMKAYPLSDEYFDQANASRPNPTAFYNRGCAYALAGDKTKAFVLLNRAADAGFTSKAQFENDKDLGSLKDDPRWVQLMKKLK